MCGVRACPDAGNNVKTVVFYRVNMYVQYTPCTHTHQPSRLLQIHSTWWNPWHHDVDTHSALYSVHVSREHGEMSWVVDADQHAPGTAPTKARPLCGYDSTQRNSGLSQFGLW